MPAYEAAASGFGVALVDRKLGSAWLESGRMTLLSEHAVPPPYRHDLRCQPGAMERWRCAAFVDWLVRSPG